MITLHWHNEVFTADKAVRDGTEIILYDAQNNEVRRISNVIGREWGNISLDGEWTEPSEVPTQQEVLRADVDYLLMLQE